MAHVAKQPILTQLIPDDILIEILFRLQVKSLLLFRSVSKHWLNIIQNPSFITMHITRPLDNYNNRNPMLVILIRTVKSIFHSRQSEIVFSLLSEDETLDDEVALETLSSSRDHNEERIGLMFQLIRPCNGVFCLRNMYGFVLFNPATRRCWKVPCSPFSIKTRDAYHSIGRNRSPFLDYFGFGCDPVSKDYKVVIFDYVDKDDSFFHGVRLFRVEIFSLSTKSWRELNSVRPVGNMSVIQGDSFCFNGALHWLGGNNSSFGYDVYGSILVFDISKEAFKRFELPNVYLNNKVYLSVSNESLNIVVHLNDVLEIWVMKEYGVNESWSKLYNLSPGEDVFRPLSLNNVEILLKMHDDRLASYNLKTKAIKKFQLHENVWLCYGFHYRESLVSLR